MKVEEFHRMAQNTDAVAHRGFGKGCFPFSNYGDNPPIDQKTPASREKNYTVAPLAFGRRKCSSSRGMISTKLHGPWR